MFSWFSGVSAVVKDELKNKFTNTAEKKELDETEDDYAHLESFYDEEDVRDMENEEEEEEERDEWEGEEEEEMERVDETARGEESAEKERREEMSLSRINSSAHNATNGILTSFLQNCTAPFKKALNDTFNNVFDFDFHQVIERKMTRTSEKMGLETVYEYRDFKERGTTECKMCNRRVRGLQIQALLRHACKHNQEALRYQCPCCEFRDHFAFTLRKHIKGVHDSDKSPIDRRDASLEDSWLHLTSQCFPDQMRRVKNYVIRTRKNAPKKPKQTLKCMLCTHSVENRVIPLYQHIGRHCALKRFSCVTCAHECSTRATVITHIRMCHEGQGDFVVNCNDELDRIWKRAGIQCFPSQFDKIETYIQRESKRRNNVITNIKPMDSSKIGNQTNNTFTSSITSQVQPS